MKNKRLDNSRAFYQLRQFLTYQTIERGVKLVWIDPRYTSQTCHNCFHTGLMILRLYYFVLQVEVRAVRWEPDRRWRSGRRASADKGAVIAPERASPPLADRDRWRKLRSASGSASLPARGTGRVSGNASLSLPTDKRSL
ncbi:zinc ribbon domain-containing protein [Pannus brasiliensis]|uniref:zinc ribbon domain-containing protein n=1 Tax=Pannus brasiliensis TaxID=1579216 RepID=UPI003BEF087E